MSARPTRRRRSVAVDVDTKTGDVTVTIPWWCVQGSIEYDGSSHKRTMTVDADGTSMSVPVDEKTFFKWWRAAERARAKALKGGVSTRRPTRAIVRGP